MLKIALAQVSPVVGDFKRNQEAIIDFSERAIQNEAQLLVTPELAVCGYPPHDLLDRPDIFTKNQLACEYLAEWSSGRPGFDLLLGYVGKNPENTGRKALNQVGLLSGGKFVFNQSKSLLPTYDVFDEARYFEPAKEVQVCEWQGLRLGLSICEDLWSEDPIWGRRLYGDLSPVAQFKEQGIDLLISSSASPFEKDKVQKRLEIHQAIARELSVPVIYVNQVGATDEILFDGGSFALDARGKLLGRLPHFEQAMAWVDFDPVKKTLEWSSDWIEEGERFLKPVGEDSQALVLRALTTGIREYFSRTGFKMAIIGLSGGIDSALVAALAQLALGAKNVYGVAMPSQYSSTESLEDAQESARRLGIFFESRPIKFMFSTLHRELAERRGGKLADLAQENLQARLRGVTLMALANHYHAIVLPTSNKSELAMGYCTMYGDMCGALGPIGDLYKIEVFELARYLNQNYADWGFEQPPIPEQSISKPPSAELRHDQKDEDSLPPYDLLDPFLKDYLELGVSLEDLEKKYGSNLAEFQHQVTGLIKTLELNEYKRRQAAPVLKVSQKAFGIGRRIPIAKKWDQ